MKVSVKENLKILVIDDSTDFRGIIQNYLRKKGFNNIITASDGDLAYESLVKSFVDNSLVEIILLDWNMPKLSGIDFVSKLKENKDFCDIPIIMITGENEGEKVKEALKSGISSYIIKPLNKETLFNHICEVINKSSKKKKLKKKLF